MNSYRPVATKLEKITVFSTFSSSACAHQALLSNQGLGIASGTTRSLGVDGRPLSSCTTNTLRAEKGRGNIPAVPKLHGLGMGQPY